MSFTHITFRESAAKSPDVWAEVSDSQIAQLQEWLSEPYSAYVAIKNAPRPGADCDPDGFADCVVVSAAAEQFVEYRRRALAAFQFLNFFGLEISANEKAGAVEIRKAQRGHSKPMQQERIDLC